MARLLGAADAEEIAGRRVAGLWNGACAPADSARVPAVTTGQPIPSSRQRLGRLDGTTVDVEANGTRIIYEGEPAILGVFTERPREPIPSFSGAHRARRWSEIVNGLPCGILCARPRGRMVFANEHFLDFTGLRLRDTLRHGWLNAIAVEDRRGCREAWERSIATGERLEIEFRLRGRDGSQRWHRGVGVPFRTGEGRILRWCVLLDDVEQHKRGEAALEVNEKRFRRLFEGNLVGLVIGSPEQIMEVNDMFLRIVNRTRAEFEEGAISWMSIVPPEELDLARGKFEELLRKGECPPYETAFLSKDGRRTPILLACMLLAREPEVRVMALMVDVTERRQMQQIKAEKMKLETVSILAAGMAHNLNNLLTAVIGNASLLLDQHIGANNARAYALVRDIITAGDRAASLVNKLLASAGQSQLSAPATNLGTTIRQEEKRVRAGLPANVTLHLDVQPRLPPVLITAEQLRQVVDGLVTNAVEAIGEREDGHVWLSLRVEHIGLKAAAERFAAEQLTSGDYCVLEVRDNGSGMDPATLVRIFDPFFTTKFMGRGLGLAAIAGIVRGARGAVRVGSTPGAGTIFRVYLPPAAEPLP
jgi:PAS domain S-box-containing protein